MISLKQVEAIHSILIDRFGGPKKGTRLGWIGVCAPNDIGDATSRLLRGGWVAESLNGMLTKKGSLATTEANSYLLRKARKKWDLV